MRLSILDSLFLVEVLRFFPPSLTKPHHEHAHGGGGDDYDGCGIHGFSPNLARALPVFDGGVSDSSYAS